jgi:uncharacterized protein YjbJ (UPF0337 family)
MNRDQFTGRCKQIKGMLKNQWGKLRHDAVTQHMGELERLVGVFQEQCGNSQAKTRQKSAIEG